MISKQKFVTALGQKSPKALSTEQLQELVQPKQKILVKSSMGGSGETTMDLLSSKLRLVRSVNRE
jgi:hypothetical protein